MTAAVSETIPPVLRAILGQDRARELLAGSLASPVHAYLLLGPAGSGKREAATAFAAALVCPRGGCGACPACRDALAGRHPDVTVVARRGPAISVGEARAVAALAQRSPRAGGRQVLVLEEFHLVEEAAPALLKTLEEPPASTVFLVLADALPPSLATIASRCVQVAFRPLSESALEELLARDGVDRAVASAAAAAAGGRLDRARLLAQDEGFAARQGRWRAVPDRLDGTGATAAVLAGELVEAADELVEVLKGRQAAELEAAREQAELLGERAVPGRQGTEERHRREQRRVRTDELRAGLATLAGFYRERLATPGGDRHLRGDLACCEAIDQAAEALVRNPNELLLVQALLVSLDQAAHG